ncbi:MAG: glycosyltransferase family 9 protein [Candidatus Omnitrophica bacterium]|jgi:ADP-heptose:LPS heptosyltransferase|nr:glycosyltransferase family 9 protein [Candidatus Omnitrophota bacterium]
MSIKKILAVRNDRFGEFLLNIPAFRDLKSKFPQAKLTLVVNPYVKELAHCVEAADEVICWENKPHKVGEIISFSNRLRMKKFDLCLIFNPSKEFNIISFLAGIRERIGYDRKWAFLLTKKIADKKNLGKKHEIDYNLDLSRLAGAESGDRELSLRVNQRFDEGVLKGINSDRAVVIHPWTSDSLKQWPAHKFFILAQRLINELQLELIFIGGKEESEQSKELLSGLGAEAVNLTGKTSLLQLAAILKRSRLLISGDSGPIHLASCVGTPVLAIFRNDLLGKGPLRWGPRSANSIVVEKSSLMDISVEEVFNKAKEVLKI